MMLPEVKVSHGPLAGIKVVEIAAIGPGPIAGMMLADMGADVILVERKGRNALYASVEGDVSDALIFNRGKRSIAVDLKQPDGLEVVLGLIAEADLLIEGFRPGVMERLGLGPDVVLNRNPKLVYGRMTGWGQTGPLSKAAGHDYNYIGLSGALWYGGGKDRAPRAPLTLVGDVGGGAMVLLWGVLCALVHAQKTGEGQVVDCAISDGSAYISTLLWSMLHTGQLKRELGVSFADGGAPWSDTYLCADGKYVTVQAIEPQFYAVLVERLGLKDDPTFAHQYDASKWPQGKVEIAKLFLTKTRAEWCELLEGTDACFAPVLDFTEAPTHPHNVARETFLEVDGLTHPAPAPKLSRRGPSAGRVPKPGQHTEEILKEAGHTPRAIDELKAKGAVD
jgi:alpha-methylacyl-CoA racemase